MSKLAICIGVPQREARFIEHAWKGCPHVSIYSYRACGQTVDLDSLAEKHGFISGTSGAVSLEATYLVDAGSVQTW